MTIGPIGSRSAMSLAVHNKENGLRWWVGCQHGITSDALRARVKDTHGDNAHAINYMLAIEFVESHPALAAHIKTLEAA